MNTENIYSSLLLPPRRVREGVPPRGGNEEDGGCGSRGTGADEEEPPAVGVEPWNLGTKGPYGGGGAISTRSSSSWNRSKNSCKKKNTS